MNASGSNRDSSNTLLHLRHDCLPDWKGRTGALSISGLSHSRVQVRNKFVGGDRKNPAAHLHSIGKLSTANDRTENNPRRCRRHCSLPAPYPTHVRSCMVPSVSRKPGVPYLPAAFVFPRSYFSRCNELK